MAAKETDLSPGCRSSCCRTASRRTCRRRKHLRLSFIDGVARCRESEAAAGDKAVNLMGANLAQQFLRAGLLHEIQIHLMPVLLRTGVRLFDQFGTENIELETVRVVHSSGVTHLWFRVVK